MLWGVINCRIRLLLVLCRCGRHHWVSHYDEWLQSNALCTQIAVLC